MLPDEYVIGRIKYVDYHSSTGFTVAGSDSAFPFFEHAYHKRLEYRYENEIRAARLPRSGSTQESSSADVVIPNLSDLIDVVCIRRSDSDETKNSVENLCRKHKFEYRESRINDQPLQIRMSEPQRKILIDKIIAAQIPESEKLRAALITKLFVETIRGE